MTLKPIPSMSRRSALTRLCAGALGLVLAGRGLGVAAQDATPSVPLTGHPVAGVWRWTNYPGASDEDTSLSIFAEAGTCVDTGTLPWCGRWTSAGSWRRSNRS
jgi:hypothetical protein